MENTESNKKEPLFNPTDELTIPFGFLSEISDLTNYIYDNYGQERFKKLLFDKVHKETNEKATKKISDKKLEEYVDVPAFARTAMGGYETHLTELGDMMIKLQMRIKALVEVNAENKIGQQPTKDVAKMEVVTSEEE